ncbi:hypothetical protein MC885_000144 [Smutsia gigantea]|nr:hypothetical protein MC885_000144 [Smutsia gigantea]
MPRELGSSYKGSCICPAGAVPQLMPRRGHPSQEGLWALSCLLMAHEPEPEAGGLLDLSFLTEEEQEAIADVLKRDAHLRQLEEGRILTGDWFQEARSLRHHHAHLGSDLVRASIRRKKSSRGAQAAGSDREVEAAGKETKEKLEPRCPMDRASQESLSEAEVCSEEADPEPEPRAPEEQELRPRPAQVGGSGPRLLSRRGADSRRGVFPPKFVNYPGPKAVGKGAGSEGRPRHFPPLQTQAASEILENGEETPGPGPSLDRMLSSSSSVSSLNSSTLSGSQMSLSGEAEAGAVQVHGSLHFGLRYEQGAAELRVHVIHYVKSYLLPDKQSKRKTAVKKRNLNPVFNETLRYSVPQAELRDRVLNLSVWHRESLGRNIFLGEVEVPLDTWDWDSEPIWLALQPRVPSSPDDLPSRGLLSLSLKYIPAGSEGPGMPESGELHFWVKEAQNLVPLRSGSLDTYIQCSVLPDDSRASRQRTRVVRRSLSPMFNHTMVYDGFGPADLRQACAELALWDHGALISRHYGLQVPWMDSTPEEKQLWQTLLERPCEWVDGLLPLRTNLAPRT